MAGTEIDLFQLIQTALSPVGRRSEGQFKEI
jgi:hypothetical protein